MQLPWFHRKTPFQRPSTLVIIMLGLNAIALTILILIILDQGNAIIPSAPARALSPITTPPWIKSWFVPLSGPKHIAIQIGHLKNLELPAEQRHLRGNDGAVVQRIKEWEINQQVALALARRLRGEGMDIIILPATVPPGLRVDAFVAIHCDWADRSKNHGWKVAAPAIGNQASTVLAASIANSFDLETAIRHDLAALSDTMYDYYAFNWRTYKHALSPLSPAVIVELGFMSNPGEFKLLTKKPDYYAAILERGIRQFLAKTSRNDPSMLVPPP